MFRNNYFKFLKLLSISNFLKYRKNQINRSNVSCLKLFRKKTGVGVVENKPPPIHDKFNKNDAFIVFNILSNKITSFSIIHLGCVDSSDLVRYNF